MSEIRELLRRLRAERGLSQEQLGAAIRISASSIASFESGRMIPKPDTAKNLDDYFGTGDEIQKAAARAREAARPVWFGPWREIEERAAMLRYWQLGVIPGLLQTEEYARSVLDDGWRGPAEIEERLADRMERQAAILDRDGPGQYAFIMDAAALRCGPGEIAKRQLRHLVDVGERSNVFVQVVPNSTGVHPGRSGSFAIAILEDGRSVGYQEDLLEGRVISESARVAVLGRTWQAVSVVALPADQSRDLLLKMVSDL